MTYQMSEQDKVGITNPLSYSDSRLLLNLDILKKPGAAAEYDKPISYRDLASGNDFRGYTAVWIEALEAEKDRRIRANVWSV